MRLEDLARAVVANWEGGDLAAAVRELSAHLDEITENRERFKHEIDEASNRYGDDNLSIDDDCFISDCGDGVGVWVSAWVFVPGENYGKDYDDEEA